MDEPTKVVDVSKRTIKDGNGEEGRYTKRCRIEQNESTGRRLHISIGRGRMEYANNSVYDGEWRDDYRDGDGSFTHHSVHPEW